MWKSNNVWIKDHKYIYFNLTGLQITQWRQWRLGKRQGNLEEPGISSRKKVDNISNSSRQPKMNWHTSIRKSTSWRGLSKQNLITLWMKWTWSVRFITRALWLAMTLQKFYNPFTSNKLFTSSSQLKSNSNMGKSRSLATTNLWAKYQLCSPNCPNVSNFTQQVLLCALMKLLFWEQDVLALATGFQ